MSKKVCCSRFIDLAHVPGQKIDKDENGAKVDVTLYKQTVGSLMYLTATRLDLMFVVSLINIGTRSL